MKKIILSSLTILFAFTFIPNEIKAETSSIKTELPTNSIVSKTISSVGLRKINKESKLTSNAIDVNISSNKKNHVGPGGIYISVGALIIIILLIIIFL